MKPHPYLPIGLAAVVLAGLCLAQPPTLQEWPITYAEPPPCSSHSGGSHDPHGHPGSTHDLAFDPNDPAPRCG